MAYFTEPRLGQDFTMVEIPPAESQQTLIGQFADLWASFLQRAQDFLALSTTLTLLQEQYTSLYREAATRGRTDLATEAASGATQVAALREEAGPVVEFVGRWLPIWQGLARSLGLRGTGSALGQIPVIVTLAGLVAAIAALTYVMITKLYLLAEKDRLTTGLQAIRDKLLTTEEAKQLGLTLDYPAKPPAQGWGEWLSGSFLGIPRWVALASVGLYGLVFLGAWPPARPAPARRRR